MTNLIFRSATLILLLTGLAIACGDDDNAPRNKGGGMTCATTREECIAMFQGTYAGTYAGSDTGAWSLFIAEDGAIEGTITNSAGVAIPTTGEVDETGSVEFASSQIGTFRGVIDFDQKVSGDWSGSAGSGSFVGAFVSRDPLGGTGGTGSGSGGTGGTSPGTGGAGNAGSYCDRAATKAEQCDVPTNGECFEPTTDEERCQAECVLALTCAEIQGVTAIFDCATECASDGTRDYCGEYTDKMEECAKQDTLLMLDICGMVTPNPSDECVWGCVLDASCEEFQAEEALLDACRTVCG